VGCYIKDIVGEVGKRSMERADQAMVLGREV
jgi:hypothetical protein